MAIGTLVSMLFRTTQYIWYYHTKLVSDREGLKFELKRLAVSALEIGIFVLFASLLPEVHIGGYLKWILYSLGVGAFCLLTVVACSYVFYREQWKDLMHLIRHLGRRGKKKTTD